MPLIKDLIELPDQVRQGDFVLRLSEGLKNPKETLDNYVVTPELAACFEEGLKLVKAALQSNSSKGAYLHGSFGSGKSHWMAVLNLMLANQPEIQDKPELPPILAKSDWPNWGHGKRFLMVPFHMIGAKDLTSHILGGYTQFVTGLHPDKPHPGVYRSERLLENAKEIRKNIGDSKFFEMINKGGGGQDDSGWGDMGTAWDAESFNRASSANPLDPERIRLVGDLVGTIFTHAHGTTDYIDLDNGLAVISQHAHSLGYDAVIFFLDELILWLASHAGSPEFVTQQGQLLAKLVESQNVNRKVPLISFMARQKDLRELVGDTMIGAQYVSFSDSIKHFDGRFEVIKLNDRNLPTIAEKRVLRPRSEAAKQQIDEEFQKTERLGAQILDVLQTSHYDRTLFRKIYPFSPALMDTLVALSTLLQRERTALKIMLQLLVEQRDTLELGQIIPVGDIFDAIMQGGNPFSDVLRLHFENATKLYAQQLLPLIETECGITKQQAALGSPTDPKVMAFRRDDRLAKTLLLSALAPEVESFKAMTANKLAALNYGSIRSPIPGREGHLVLQKCRTWAASIGQIRIGDEPTNPSISVQLAGVDTESLIAQTATEDNNGNRIRKVKELVYEMMGLTMADDLWIGHDFVWRGTKRRCQFLFANIRELNFETLNNPEEGWKVIIDWPFDTENHGPRDDLSKLEAFRQQQPTGCRTIAWTPSFLNNAAQRDLGTLVKLDHILTGDRFTQYANRLSAVERTQAKALLENQASALRTKVKGYLEAAYGLAADKSALDATHRLDPDEQIISLHPQVTLPVPSASNLKDAAEEILSEALKAQFPNHPDFETDTRISSPSIKRVWNELEKALQTPDGRSLVDPSLRREVTLIAQPLKLATMGDTHLVVNDHWKQHFTLRETAGEPTTVRKLRKWMDEPQAMGLPIELQNLIILYFAARADRSFVLHGGPAQPTLETIRDDVELKAQPLPSPTQWKDARTRAEAIFGLTPSSVCNANNAAKLSSEVKAEALKLLPGTQSLVTELESRLQQQGVSPHASLRLSTAYAARDLLDAIRAATDAQVLIALATAPITQQPLILGTSIRQAGSTATALQKTKWMIITAASALEDYRKAAGAAIATRITEILTKNEQDCPLLQRLSQVEEDAAKLLADRPPSPPPAPVAPTPAPTPTSATTNKGETPTSGPTPSWTPQPTTTPAATAPISPGVPSPTKATASKWYGSDSAEAEQVYAQQPDLLARNRRLVAELKALYGESQIVGDHLPTGLPKTQLLEALEVHHIEQLSIGGPDERRNMIVVTASVHALIHADPNCRIDLVNRTMVLFGVTLQINVKANHNG